MVVTWQLVLPFCSNKQVATELQVIHIGICILKICVQQIDILSYFSITQVKIFALFGRTLKVFFEPVETKI